MSQAVAVVWRIKNANAAHFLTRSARCSGSILENFIHATPSV